MTYASASARRWPAPALAVIVAVFLAYSLPPYFTGATRVPLTFALHYPLLAAHVMLASAAMVSAVAQVWPRLRTRHPVLHRRMGRIYVTSAIPAALCAMVIGAATPFGPFLAVSNVLLSALWLWFTVKGYLAGRQRRYAEHRRHMVRSATLALSIMTNRVWTPVLAMSLDPLQDSLFDGDQEHFNWLVTGVGGWLGWTMPLMTLQWWLNRESVTPSPVSQQTYTHRV
ncbi:DUF2306 domain-containing protein [Mycobacterium sp. URHB0021]|jgi:uncharacterized membrane protein